MAGGYLKKKNNKNVPNAARNDVVRRTGNQTDQHAQKCLQILCTYVDLCLYCIVVQFCHENLPLSKISKHRQMPQHKFAHFIELLFLMMMTMMMMTLMLASKKLNVIEHLCQNTLLRLN